MDLCHLILGRPWQYDITAIHDGRANTYTIEWKGKQLKLLPVGQPPSQLNAHNLLSARLVKDTSLPIIVVVVEDHAGRGQPTPHHSIQNLLKDYLDLASPELPSSLPPLQNL